jgi:uncharacterized MAPEG superfamily protein
MDVFTGSIELQMLFCSVLLGLAQLLAAAMLSTRDKGVAHNLSPRDDQGAPVSVLTGRMQRAFANFKETFAFFAAAVLLVTILGRESELSAWGAQLYFWARLAYVPVYAAGIPGLRSAIWTVSLVGLLLVLASIAF